MPPVSGASLPNLRDVGGKRTHAGAVVRVGQLYRSSAPVRLSRSEVAEIERLGLRSVFDLRSQAERELAPDDLPEGVDYQGFDVLEGASGVAPADQELLLGDPLTAGRILTGKSGTEVAESRFRDLVRLDGARRGFGTLFATLADAARRPALIHCSTGKDRTGWAVAAILTLLEVPRERVIADYLLSGELLEPVLRHERRAFVDRGGDQKLFDSLWGVRRENLEAAFDEMRRTYGSVDDYFERGLGLDASLRQALRAAFVERTPA